MPGVPGMGPARRALPDRVCRIGDGGGAGGGGFRRRGRARPGDSGKAGRWRGKGKHYSGCGWRVRIGGGEGRAVAGQRQAPTPMASGRAFSGHRQGDAWRECEGVEPTYPARHEA